MAVPDDGVEIFIDDCEKRASRSLQSDAQESTRQSVLSWLSKTLSPQLPRAAKSAWKTPTALAPRHSNIMPDHREGSPSKKRRVADAEDEEEEEGEWVRDLDNTPRAGRQGTRLPVRPAANMPASASASNTSSPSRSSQSNKSQRSLSPVKKMPDMLLRPQPIVSVQFDDPKTTMPPTLTTMLSKVRQFGRGLGVVSESSRVRFSLSSALCSQGNVSR